MEQRYILITAALLCGGGLAAQPTLTAGNNVPAAGRDFPFSAGTDFFSAGPDGGPNLYGFWMLQATGNRVMYHRAASVTPTSAQVPSATLISTDGGTDTLFWAVTGAGLELVGEKRDGLGMIPYSDAGLEIKYPCSLGTIWSDPTGASFSVAGFPVQRTGTVAGHADGYGTLELPRVVLNNVLRVRVRRAVNDVSAIATVNRSTVTHYFFTDTVPYPVLKLVVDTTIINNGAPAVQRSAQWMYGDGTTGVGDLGFGDVRFTAYPNPASGPVNITMDHGTDARFLEVFDGTGRMVLQKGIPDRTEVVQGAFDVGALAPGVYHVRLSGVHGPLGTQRLVVE